jgi:hypothetical protein
MVLLLSSFDPTRLSAGEELGPEATLHLIVKANAARDLGTLSRYMSHDLDAVGYTVDGHKYVGWPLLEAEMRAEFTAVRKLELPITYLQVWQKGEVAWFAMELDYIRYFSGEEPSERMVLPLRETGVLGRRDGRWILVAWHESGRHPDTGLGSRLAISTLVDDRRDGPEASNGINVGGEWDITEVRRQEKLPRDARCPGQRPLYVAGRADRDHSGSRSTLAGDLDATRKRPRRRL